MSLSSMAMISSPIITNPKPEVPPWGPIPFIFPNHLTSYTVNNNTFTYSLGTGTNAYKNGTYNIRANCWRDINPPHLMFNGNASNFYMCGVNGGVNYKLDGTTAVYNRNAYTINTRPATFVGGNTNGTVFWSTNGIRGEFFQIEYPFNYVLTKIYIRGEAKYFTRSPKNLYIFGSNDGSTWIQIALVITTIANATTEYSYNVTNTTQYKFYRFVINTLVGGNSWDGATTIAIFRTEGQSYQLV